LQASILSAEEFTGKLHAAQQLPAEQRPTASMAVWASKAKNYWLSAVTEACAALSEPKLQAKVRFL
jgi:hypothetical protein